MTTIERYCDRALLLEGSKLVAVGKSSHIANMYEQLFLRDSNKSNENTEKSTTKNINSSKDIEAKIWIEQKSKKVKGVDALNNFVVVVAVKSKSVVSAANIGINIRNAQGILVFSSDIRRQVGTLNLKKGSKKEVHISIDNYFTNGAYTIDLNIVNEQDISDKVLLKEKEVAKFSIFGIREHAHSLFHPKSHVKVVNAQKDHE